MQQNVEFNFVFVIEHMGTRVFGCSASFFVRDRVSLFHLREHRCLDVMLRVACLLVGCCWLLQRLFAVVVVAVVVVAAVDVVFVVVGSFESTSFVFAFDSSFATVPSVAVVGIGVFHGISHVGFRRAEYHSRID